MSFRDQDRGAQPGRSPVQEAIQAAESRLRTDAPVAAAAGVFSVFDAAEAAWLRALAEDCRLGSGPEIDDRALGEAAWHVVRTASAAFALTPSPGLLDLSRKFFLIEREAFDVAHNDACGKDLAIWLAALRLDLVRLLAQPASKLDT